MSLLEEQHQKLQKILSEIRQDLPDQAKREIRQKLNRIAGKAIMPSMTRMIRLSSRG